MVTNKSIPEEKAWAIGMPVRPKLKVYMHMYERYSGHGLDDTGYHGYIGDALARQPSFP